MIFQEQMLLFHQLLLCMYPVSYTHLDVYKRQELGVDKKDIYVNTSATTDGAIIKVGDNFYRAISGTDQDSYLLEKMDLYKTDVELVEVEK